WLHVLLRVRSAAGPSRGQPLVPPICRARERGCPAHYWFEQSAYARNKQNRASIETSSQLFFWRGLFEIWAGASKSGADSDRCGGTHAPLRFRVGSVLVLLYRSSPILDNRHCVVLYETFRGWANRRYAGIH